MEKWRCQNNPSITQSKEYSVATESIMSWVEGFDLVLLYSALAGAGGGCTTFVYGLRMGHYRENRYKLKLSTEVVGGSTVALFVSLAFTSFSVPFRTFLAFAIGLTWVTVIQQLR